MRAADPEQVKEWKAAMLTAYRETGAIGASCAHVGILPIRHKRWLHEDASYAVAVAAITGERSARGLRSGRAQSPGRPVDEQRRQEQQDRFLEAFARIGFVDAAAKAAGVAFKNHYRWLSDDPSYSERFLAADAAAETSGVRRGERPHRARTPEGRERARQIAIAREAAKTPKEKARRDAYLARNVAKIKGGAWITEIEGKVMEALNDWEVPYLVHFPVGAYVADVYVPSHHLDVEADGAAFHTAGTARREAERDAALAAVGVTVLRLTEAEIRAADWSRLRAALEAG